MDSANAERTVITQIEALCVALEGASLQVHYLAHHAGRFPQCRAPECAGARRLVEDARPLPLICPMSGIVLDG